MFVTSTHRVIVISIIVTIAIGASGYSQGRKKPEPLAPLPELTKKPPAAQVELGKLLFFDKRLGGDATISCSTCHDPAKNWTDGMALSAGYPGTLYFRNTPTVINAVHGKYLYWDGRLPASDLPTLVRDHISEAHFMYADGRLLIERMRQIPGYEEMFKTAFGSEPTYGGILKAVAAFLATLRSQDVPFDQYLKGKQDAISQESKRGLALFKNKASCIRCHSGPMLSDGKFHNLGLPTNQDIFQEPKRHISFRRFFKTFGVARYGKLRSDLGRYAVTKEESDRGRIRTPTLRELFRTAPYMHDGSLSTLEDVVDFYNGGGGKDNNALLKPLNLNDREKADLIAFLKTLSGKPITVGTINHPKYELRKLGNN